MQAHVRKNIQMVLQDKLSRDTTNLVIGYLDVATKFRIKDHCKFQKDEIGIDISFQIPSNEIILYRWFKSIDRGSTYHRILKFQISPDSILTDATKMDELVTKMIVGNPMPNIGTLTHENYRFGNGKCLNISHDFNGSETRRKQMCQRLAIQCRYLLNSV